MARIKRRTCALLEMETTYHDGTVPAAADDAVLLVDADFDPDLKTIERPLLRAFMGNSDMLPGTELMPFKLTAELANSGTAGTVPAIGRLLRSLGLQQSSGLTTPSRVEYTPRSEGFESAAAYLYADQVLHKAGGVFGTAVISLMTNELPKIACDMLGLYDGLEEVSNPTPTLTAWKQPIPVKKLNVTDITLGGTYSAGAITGGTVYPSRGLEITLGNDVQHDETLSDDEVDIVDRKIVGKTTLKLTAAQEVALIGAVRAGTPTSLAFKIGSDAGKAILIFAPSVRLMNPKTEVVNGKLMKAFDLAFLPVSGNDELRIVFL